MALRASLRAALRHGFRRSGVGDACDAADLRALAGTGPRPHRRGSLRRPAPRAAAFEARAPGRVAPPADGGRRRPSTATSDARDAPAERRVAASAPAAAPKPGKRMAREAQPSFLDEAGGYALPPLTLLAEPRKSRPAPTISADALEQNAALLEGVLEDFGVRARSSMSAPARSSRSTSSSRRRASNPRASSASPTTSPAR